MKIIKLENQKNDSFFEAECFLHIGEAKEDKNYVAFNLRREDDPLYSCSYYDFEKEKGDKIFHCFDGQDYSWKCFENEVTNDEKLKNEILGNYDILRNSTIRYLKEIIHKNKVDFSKKLIELLEKIKAGEKINKKEFRIELKKVGLYKSIWKAKTEIFDDIITREIGFENIMKFIEENNVNRIVFENGEFLENEEIGKFIREYLIRDEENPDSEKDFGKNIIPMMLNEGKNIYAYPFYGYWKDVGTIESLWEANMDLIKNKENFNIDDRLWRIYYRHEGAMPQYLGHSANVKNSMISDGTAVYGTISESIISSGVRIEEGAEVIGSIIMKDVLIEKGARIYNSIIAEGSVVKENIEVGNREIEIGKEQITVIGRDEVVNENRKVEGK